MTMQQLSQAVAIARSGKSLDIESMGIFDGFGLPDFKPVVCTLDALAMLIRWQCVQFNGELDHEALNEIAERGRHRFHVVGTESEVAA